MNISKALVDLPPKSASNRSAVVLVRHGEREAVASHEFPRHDAPLTVVGQRYARELGVLVGDRLGTVRSSPVPRCVETARHIVDGSGQRLTVQTDNRLGDPGAYVVDDQLAMVSLRTIGLHPAAKRLGSGECVPGFIEPDLATRVLVALAESLLAGNGSMVHLLVSHDLIISTFVARLIGRPLLESEWPDYLHGVVLWKDSGTMWVMYRGTQSPVPLPYRSAGAY